jgi:putative transposase
VQRPDASRQRGSPSGYARKHQITEQTLYLWRRRFGGMDKSQVTDLKRLEQENGRLKKLLAERDLEIEVMKEINAKKW